MNGFGNCCKATTAQKKPVEGKEGFLVMIWRIRLDAKY